MPVFLCLPYNPVFDVMSWTRTFTPHATTIHLINILINGPFVCQPSFKDRNVSGLLFLMMFSGMPVSLFFQAGCSETFHAFSLFKINAALWLLYQKYSLALTQLSHNAISVQESIDRNVWSLQ